MRKLEAVIISCLYGDLIYREKGPNEPLTDGHLDPIWSMVRLSRHIAINVHCNCPGYIASFWKGHSGLEHYV